MAPPRSVAVVGGGITGLSAAFHLSRRFPPRTGTRITLVESSPRLGGWVRSERVRIKDGNSREADVLLESGPRTLRPNSKAILELVHLLGLTPSLLTVPRNAPAARNRFLHIPGSTGLTAIPTSLPSLLRSPLAKTLVPAVLRDALSSNRTVLSASDDDNDESVDAFLTRHFGPAFAQTFGSALVHGIYAADSRVLSVRAAFPMLCQLEAAGKGSVVRGAVRDMLSAARRKKQDVAEMGRKGEYELGEVVQLMKGVSVYSFRDGMQTLTDAMESRLRENDNVDIVKGDGAAALRRTGTGFELTTESGKRITSSHLVCAIPLPRLSQLLADPPASEPRLLPHLHANPSSSVTVVNLVFPPTPAPIHPAGFGYLIPRPPSGYLSSPTSPTSSSLGMLGTVFDSCALPAQDTPSGAFTKVTVMLGGPYGAPSPTPTSPAFLPALLEALRTHLSLEPGALPDPCLVRVREHRECIPTPTVGHVARVRELGAAVRARLGPNAWVVGAGVGGVSVGDCVEGGRRVALEV
ncbi:hypothetical protein C8Q76DRAFT_726194 [Earliella scabrosa]|nr:hypothetical protein C8Q76DRAFT_726194 [Earliella scabrosa]